MSKLVSVIVPCYNAETTIIQTLDSVLASTYKDIEVVVVDDMSTDNSLSLLKDYASRDSRVHVYNLDFKGGASWARNSAIRRSYGEYVLPVDADDIIAPEYIEKAVEVLDAESEVKAVGCRAEFFGDRHGEWKLPPFSLKTLARKNMIPITAMYRKSDYYMTYGYNESFPYREDWDFWLSIFDNGGEYHKLDYTGLYYRVRKNSKRITDRARKRELIYWLNLRHEEYFKRYLGGPLHYHRSWSRFINFFRSEKKEGFYGDWFGGEVIHSGRNIIRLCRGSVIKYFTPPCLIKAFIYGCLRKSKARRSYEYAQKLGDLTPQPVAYREIRMFGLLRDSWYVCRLSECEHTFNELIGNKDFPNRATILEAIGCFTARLHEKGWLHKDYSGGNILFNDDGSRIQIVDLNRLVQLPSVSQKKGCRNFERLNIDREALTILAHSYAQVRGFDKEQCAQDIIRMRWNKHKRQGITNI